MNLHCDIFFKKKKDLLVKSVYITAMYRCDKDMIARLNIADVLLKQYKQGESGVSLKLNTISHCGVLQRKWLAVDQVL